MCENYICLFEFETEVIYLLVYTKGSKLSSQLPHSISIGKNYDWGTCNLNKMDQ